MYTNTLSKEMSSFKSLALSIGIDLKMDESQIFMLQHTYKEQFSDDEWKSICIFVNQFSKLCNSEAMTYEETVKAR